MSVHAARNASPARLNSIKAVIMAPTPQSRFLEGSMNDRASNAPPPDFLGFDAEATAEYERQFALDWQPPDLGLRHQGTRNSFMSVNSAVSSATTTRKQNGPSFLAPLWGGVKERLSLNRSKSSNNVHDRDEDSSCQGHFISPTFKHQRSGSVNVARPSRHAEAGALPASGDGAKLKKFPSAAAIPSAAGPSANIPGPAAFDPTGRPTRDEIAANYQSLLASGFFGNRAIQSTRFSAPGQTQNRSSMPNADSFAQRMAEDSQQEEQDQDSAVLPPPDRNPPPPPPNRTAPPPPPVTSMDTTSPSSSAAVSSGSYLLFPPSIKNQQQASRDMPPPPSPPKQRKPGHKPSASFSSVPYTSTRPTNETSASRPFRPPPVSLARFSLDSGRRSFDFKLGSDSSRGIKRPFTATNDSEMSLDRPSYDIINGDGSGAMVTASDYGGHESGARKLVKKLRKSASRISIDLGKSISRPASSNFDANDGDAEITDSSSLPRKSMSSSIRRSFSWRMGRSAPDSKDDSRHGDVTGSGESADRAVEAPAAPQFNSQRFIPPSLSVIMDAPESPERNKLKKRDIRGRRMRRQEANRSFHAPPLHQAPSPLLSPPGDGDVAMTMDWQSTRHSDRSKSRSRSRPRRSELSMMMVQSQPQSQPPSQSQSQSRPGTAHSTDSSYSFATSSAAASFEPRRSAEVASAAADDRMDVEPVEFVVPSFHFPNRVRPGNPLTVIPDANRGIPSVPNIPGEFRDVKIVARERGENGDDDDDADGAGGNSNGGAQAGPWRSAQQAVS